MRYKLKISVQCTEVDEQLRKTWKKRVSDDVRECQQSVTDLTLLWHLDTAIFVFEVSESEKKAGKFNALVDRVEKFVSHAAVEPCDVNLESIPKGKVAPMRHYVAH